MPMGSLIDFEFRRSFVPVATLLQVEDDLK